MREARHVTAEAKAKGSYALPARYDGPVNEVVLHDAVRAYRSNRRQGTASTKTRAEVSGGNQKPWRQKGTGRARQGTIRAAHWVGGGVVFGPKPRSYRTQLPRKVRQLARQSALNARASEGAITVIESLEFDAPKTRRLAELLGKLDLAERKVLILTAEVRRAVYLSGRNLPTVRVMPYRDASAYDVLWSDHVVIEEAAVGGHHVEGSETKTSTARAKRAKKAAGATRGNRSVTKRTKPKTATKQAKKATSRASSRKKGDTDA